MDVRLDFSFDYLLWRYICLELQFPYKKLSAASTGMPHLMFVLNFAYVFLLLHENVHESLAFCF